MSSLLHVIANPKLQETSASRQLAAHFFRCRRSFHPEESLETLDLYCEDVPWLDAYTAQLFTVDGVETSPSPFSGALKDEEAPLSWAFQASDRYVEQFLRCERVVLTLPLWNFGPPAILKAWIDLIVRAGKTFEHTPEGITPLATGKRMLLLGARGGVYSGDSPLRPYELLEPYLRTLFGVLGVEIVEAVWAEGTRHPENPETRVSIDQARQRLTHLAESF
jgi:FMN-dependent NADH-azoreductase